MASDVLNMEQSQDKDFLLKSEISERDGNPCRCCMETNLSPAMLSTCSIESQDSYIKILF
jgi:hypothetical protein